MIGDNPHIMIVDDNENLSKMMAKILIMKGFEVSVANGGLRAIELAKATPSIDIVFMDIKMPGINGVESYKLLKRVLPDTRVIMMTAYAVEELIQEALREGAQGVIYKPVDFDEIISLIQKIMNDSESANILVVDDDNNIRTSFTKILTSKGFNVESVASGEEAVKIAQENNFDIVFLDMKLPGIDGLTTYLSIKLLQPSITAIIVTGFSIEMADQIENLMMKSGYSCLQKPLDMVQVLGLMDEILSNRQADTELEVD